MARGNKDAGKADSGGDGDGDGDVVGDGDGDVVGDGDGDVVGDGDGDVVGDGDGDVDPDAGGGNKCMKTCTAGAFDVLTYCDPVGCGHTKCENGMCM